jgi:hypothetical protein
MNTFAIGLATALALGAGNVEARYVHPHDRGEQMFPTSAEVSVDHPSKICETRATMRHLTGAEREAYLATCNISH